MTPPEGSNRVHCIHPCTKHPCTSAIPERSAPAQHRRLRARFSRGPVLPRPGFPAARAPRGPLPLAPRVVQEDASAGRGAPGSESGDSGVRAARPGGHRRVDSEGSESAWLPGHHAPKTGTCRSGLRSHHSQADGTSRCNASRSYPVIGRASADGRSTSRAFRPGSAA
jgi:hypothetical protein